MKFYLPHLEYMVMVMEKSVPDTFVHNLYNNHYSTYVFSTACLHAWFLLITGCLRACKHNQVVREMSFCSPLGGARLSSFWHITIISEATDNDMCAPVCSRLSVFCGQRKCPRARISIVSAPPPPYLHISSICFDLVSRPELNQTWSGKDCNSR